MAALDHPVVLSLLCKPRYLAAADAGRLELVSRRVRLFARRCRRSVTQMCVRLVVETCTKPQVLLATLADHFANLTMVVHVEPEWLAKLARLPRLSAMHLRRLSLRADSLALLNSMTGLRTLMVSEVLGDQGADVVARLCAEARPPIALGLNHLSIRRCRNASLLAACRLELLTHLWIFVPECIDNLGWREEACRLLRQCGSLTTLEVVNGELKRLQVEDLLSAVAALPGLQNFRLPGQVEVPSSWPGFWQFCDDSRICQSLTRLRLLGSAVGEQQLARRKFPNLRHVHVLDQFVDAEHIFTWQSPLESLDYYSDTAIGATELGEIWCRVHTLTTRFALSSRCVGCIELIASSTRLPSCTQLISRGRACLVYLPRPDSSLPEVAQGLGSVLALLARWPGLTLVVESLFEPLPVWKQLLRNLRGGLDHVSWLSLRY